jgi:hypothetical protein
MSVSEGEAGAFELLGRKFTIWHGINYTQVFEVGEAEELLHFQGKRLTVEEATLAVFGWSRGREIGERAGVANFKAHLAQVLGFATAADLTHLNERLERRDGQVNGKSA